MKFKSTFLCEPSCIIIDQIPYDVRYCFRHDGTFGLPI